jgi:hypothetical protein
MRKTRTVIFCENCDSEIHRQVGEDWTPILKNAGWKWCCKPYSSRAHILCGTCTFIFENKYNINPNTGMPRK